MTYFFVFENFVWGCFVLFSLLIFGDQLFPAQSFVWPEPMAYLWSALVIIGAVVQFIFLLMDSFDIDRERIWTLAKINLAVWAFSPFLWMIIGAYSMLIVSLFGIMGCAYIGLAHKFHSPGHRI